MKIPAFILFLLPLINIYAANDTFCISDSLIKNQDVHNSTLIRNRYIKESLVPAGLALGSAGIIAIPGLKEALQKPLSWNWDENTKMHYVDLSTFKNGDFLLEDELRYLPVAAVYAADIFGVKSEHRFIDKTVVLAVSYIASDFVVHNCKKLTKSLRPGRDIFSTDDYSFPSQHTAMAFVAASFLDHELGYKSPWISVAGYGVATLVGITRIANNDHWASDVMMGAAVGILTTNVTYWAYDGIMKLFDRNISVTPVLNFKQPGLYVCYRF